MSLAAIARAHQLTPKGFEKQYKNHLSGFKDWDQKEHADRWLLFPENIGKQISIDEVAVTNGELWTVLTNKARHGKKGALIAMIQGTKTSDITGVFARIPG